MIFVHFLQKRTKPDFFAEFKQLSLTGNGTVLAIWTEKDADHLFMKCLILSPQKPFLLSWKFRLVKMCLSTESKVLSCPVLWQVVSAFSCRCKSVVWLFRLPGLLWCVTSDVSVHVSVSENPVTFCERLSCLVYHPDLLFCTHTDTHTRKPVTLHLHKTRAWPHSHH